MLINRFVVTKSLLRTRSIILQIIATIAIWSMLPFIVMIHVSLWIYQQVYFSIYAIPKAKFRDYLIIDHYKLSKLNLGQKLACTYCGYANAVAAWCKVVANRTEVYSCAIKHSVHKEGQEHQKDFFAYEDFE